MKIKYEAFYASFFPIKDTKIRGILKLILIIYKVSVCELCEVVELLEYSDG